jgi:hypothetical protein
MSMYVVVTMNDDGDIGQLHLITDSLKKAKHYALDLKSQVTVYRVPMDYTIDEGLINEEMVFECGGDPDDQDGGPDDQDGGPDDQEGLDDQDGGPASIRDGTVYCVHMTLSRGEDDEYGIEDEEVDLRIVTRNLETAKNIAKEAWLGYAVPSIARVYRVTLNQLINVNASKILFEISYVPYALEAA